MFSNLVPQELMDSLGRFRVRGRDVNTRSGRRVFIPKGQGVPSLLGHTLSIGNVASRTGLTPDTIRYYERLGLLPKPMRTTAGYRLYGEGIVNRLMLIRNAQQFGFSLRDIASFLRVRETGGKPCRDVRRAVETMLDAVDQQIADLLETRKRMQGTLRRWDQRLAEAAADQPAHLLETLGSIDRTRDERRARLKKRGLPSGLHKRRTV